MDASHESSRTQFQNSTPALDLLTETARALPGVLGARLTGGGFGGSAVILVRAEQAESVAETLAQRYREKTGVDPSPFVTKAADGAHERCGYTSAERFTDARPFVPTPAGADSCEVSRRRS